MKQKKKCSSILFEIQYLNRIYSEQGEACTKILTFMRVTIFLNCVRVLHMQVQRMPHMGWLRNNLAAEWYTETERYRFRKEETKKKLHLENDGGQISPSAWFSVIFSHSLHSQYDCGIFLGGERRFAECKWTKNEMKEMLICHYEYNFLALNLDPNPKTTGYCIQYTWDHMIQYHSGALYSTENEFWLFLNWQTSLNR